MQNEGNPHLHKVKRTNYDISNASCRYTLNKLPERVSSTKRSEQSTEDYGRFVHIVELARSYLVCRIEDCKRCLLEDQYCFASEKLLDWITVDEQFLQDTFSGSSVTGTNPALRLFKKMLSDHFTSDGSQIKHIITQRLHELKCANIDGLNCVLSFFGTIGCATESEISEDFELLVSNLWSTMSAFMDLLSHINNETGARAIWKAARAITHAMETNPVWSNTLNTMNSKLAATKRRFSKGCVKQANASVRQKFDDLLNSKVSYGVIGKTFFASDLLYSKIEELLLICKDFDDKCNADESLAQTLLRRKKSLRTKEFRYLQILLMALVIYHNGQRQELGYKMTVNRFKNVCPVSTLIEDESLKTRLNAFYCYRFDNGKTIGNHPVIFHERVYNLLKAYLVITPGFMNRLVMAKEEKTSLTEAQLRTIEHEDPLLFHTTKFGEGKQIGRQIIDTLHQLGLPCPDEHSVVYRLHRIRAYAATSSKNTNNTFEGCSALLSSKSKTLEKNYVFDNLVGACLCYEHLLKEYTAAMPLSRQAMDRLVDGNTLSQQDYGAVTQEDLDSSVEKTPDFARKRRLNFANKYR